MEEIFVEVDPVKVPIENQLLHFSNYSRSFIEISQVIWQYFGYSGLYVPWHDSVPVLYFPGYKKTLEKTIEKLVENDVSLFAFGYLSLPFHPPEDWDRPTLLFSSTKHLSWIKKLRRFVDSRENLDYLAYFMINYYQIHIEYYGKSRLEIGQVIKKDGSVYKYEGYEKLWTRILEITRLGADPILWMRSKFEMFHSAFPKESMNFSCLVNRNKLDPEISTLQKRTVDPWREIKDFLGLSIDCEIVDGYVPKGWQPSGEDFEDRAKIVKVTGDGFYYNEKGTQRRGRRHYAKNTYYGIKCTPENFGIFKDSWLDESMLMKVPTWEEYKNWAIYPDLWDESGNAINGRGRSVQWRKK